MAVMGICMPQMTLASTRCENAAGRITDLRLREDGVLLGQVVSAEQTAVAGTAVSLRSGSEELSRGKTDENGYFAFGGLRRGVYLVEAASGHGVYRVWPPGIAPPAAQSQALIVAGNDIVRGQQCCPPAQSCSPARRSCLTHPLILAGIVAAAVAIPVAIHNSRKPATP